jgi:hypothetical protein
MEVFIIDVLKFLAIAAPFIVSIAGIIWKLSGIIHTVNSHTEKIEENTTKIEELEDRHFKYEEKIIVILTDIRERMVKLETKMETVIGGRRATDIT